MNNVIDQLQPIIDAYQTGTTATVSQPDPQFGDYATNVALQLANKLGRQPREIAEEIATKLRETDTYTAVTVASPGFINIRLKNQVLFSLAKEPVAKTRENMTVVIETNNPNPFKAMHIGHAMNAIIADTLANFLEASGAHTYRVSYHGDIGLHVGRSMWALLKYTEGNVDKLDEVPVDKRNEFMSQMYAEGSKAYKENPDAKAAIDNLTKQSFTREDPTYARVYDTVFTWSFQEIDDNVHRLGNVPVEKKFLESDADLRGVQIVKEHVPAVFEESDGALIFRGSDHGSFDNVFVSSDGLGLYGARDLGLMQLKNEYFHPQKSYIVTGEEQRDYFKGIIAAAELCLPSMKDVTVNISTGLLKLTTGKMSSRDGDVITIAWLFDQIAAAIVARGGEATEEIVAGALRYAILKVRIGSDIIFDINESVSIQGNSGPYLQYAHARACSILEKTNVAPSVTIDESLDEHERALLRKLSEYPSVITRACSELLPHYICVYLYELAQEFNRFYEHSRVIGDEREAIRLTLVSLYRDTLAKGLHLLGITAPERL